MSEHNQIHGEILSPVFMTDTEFEEGYKSSVFYVEKNYMEEYRKHLIALSHVANVAKSYILNNWKKVTDWADLHVTLIHGPTGEATEYFNYVPYKPSDSDSDTWKSIQMRLDKHNKEKHNPIIEMTSVVLDPTDGDFSITVNGNKEHWWIQDEAVIVIADYIEKQLTPQE